MRKVADAGNQYQKWGRCCDESGRVGHRLLNWFAEEMGKSLYLQARNAIDHCEKNVRGHGDGNLDHQMRRGKKRQQRVSS